MVPQEVPVATEMRTDRMKVSAGSACTAATDSWQTEAPACGTAVLGEHTKKQR